MVYYNAYLLPEHHLLLPPPPLLIIDECMVYYNAYLLPDHHLLLPPPPPLIIDEGLQCMEILTSDQIIIFSSLLLFFLYCRWRFTVYYSAYLLPDPHLLLIPLDPLPVDGAEPEQSPVGIQLMLGGWKSSSFFNLSFMLWLERCWLLHSWASYVQRQAKPLVVILLI